MKFTNVFGNIIEWKPFYQDCLKVWRVALYENGELYKVFEGKEYRSEKDCLDAINEKF